MNIDENLAASVSSVLQVHYTKLVNLRSSFTLDHVGSKALQHCYDIYDKVDDSTLSIRDCLLTVLIGPRL